MRTAHGDVNPEDIFNMFFNGMGGGAPGFHMYTSGFGPGGVQFQAGRPRAQRRPQGQPAEPQRSPGLQLLFQLMPILLIALLSFMSQSDGTDSFSSRPMPGENKYFSLTQKAPFVNPLQTRLTAVKDIPFYVSDRFLNTYHRNRYQLGQVEALVEKAYEQYLSTECNRQVDHKKKLEQSANSLSDEAEKSRKLEAAKAFELTRCAELRDLFPKRANAQKRR